LRCKARRDNRGFSCTKDDGIDLYPHLSCANQIDPNRRFDGIPMRRAESQKKRRMTVLRNPGEVVVRYGTADEVRNFPALASPSASLPTACKRTLFRIDRT